MATKHRRNNDHYVASPQRDELRRHMRKGKLTMAQMAYELRMSRPHLSNMLNGKVPMAHVHMLAMRYVLLVKHAERAKAARTALAGE